MAIKNPAELKTAANTLIAERNEEERKRQEQRAAIEAKEQEEGEQHLADIVEQIEASVERLVTLAISHNVKHVIIGKFDHNEDTIGRPDWMVNETAGVFRELRRRLPATYKLEIAGASTLQPANTDKVFPIMRRHGSGSATQERWLAPAKVISTKSVKDPKHGHYLVLSWD